MEQRPLSGEPLAIDLINTLWAFGGQAHDLFASDTGVRAWLTENALDCKASISEIKTALLETRAALRGTLEDPKDATSRAAINAMLERGRVLHRLGELKPETALEINETARPAWLAAKNLLDLMEQNPKRIKRCSNPTCVLYFYDTSPKNSRRWHEMSSCGNQVKARRHYQRIHANTGE
jgi:predicted RNA-binding Zn ribbon-like protein